MKRTDLSKKPFIILTIFFIISLFSFSCSARTIDKYEQDESSYTVETLTYEEFIERIRNDFGEKAALEAKSDIKRIKNDINTARQSSQLTYKVYSETKPFRPNVDFKSHIRCLKDIDYQGFVTVEVMPFPSAIEAARRSINYMKALECVVDIENEARNLR